MARQSAALPRGHVIRELKGAPGAIAAQKMNPLRFVTIRLCDQESRAVGVYQLMRNTRVVCLPNDEFVIAKSSLATLDDHDIAYDVLGETSLDQTLESLRDSPAPLL